MTIENVHPLFRSTGGALLALGLLCLPGCVKTPASKTAAKPPLSQPEAPSAPPILTHLDADRNGLYDDTERKAMLDALLQASPDLRAALSAEHRATSGEPATAPVATFDADADGRITIAEQSAGRHPLSMLIPPQSLDRSIQIPWALDIFPEWISTAYFQDDVAIGHVAEHATRGTVTAPGTQAAESLQPQKVAAGRGVEFAENSGQYLTMPGQRDARWNYRWCIFTFRLDALAGTDAETILLDLNRGQTSNKSSPKIWYNKTTGLSIQYVGQRMGENDRRIMTTTEIATDGETWNVVVCGIRYGQMFASVNGRPLATAAPQPPRFSGEWPQQTTSYLGDASTGNIAWAYDALVFGLTEPSEAMVRKMSGWAAHRLGIQDQLPPGHPYARHVPVLDLEDLPHRYVHDNEAWTQWGASLKDKTVTRVNAGGPRLEPEGFERVFYDDFRADRVQASTSGEGDLWVGPGFNIAVGVDAPLLTPGSQPEVYPHDADSHQQTLSLAKAGNRWRGSAFYSVNDLGHGYTWQGPKVFRIRCKFPDIPQAQLARGLFPAFWSYDPGSQVWRTGNRIEVDWFEFDGKNGGWLNGLSTHFHYAYLKNNIFAKNPGSYDRYKVYSGELTEARSQIPGGLFVWDGQFHTWEFVVDKEMTYINVSIPDANGQERFVEICRSATAPTYLERLDLQLDYALKARDGVPSDGARQDFVVDWIEVLQKTEGISVVPAPFTARPVLTRAGNTVTCSPNLAGITDIRYYWFADGYPLTYGPSNTYTVPPEHDAAEIRCMVKAVGARDMPEAWTQGLK